MSTRATLIWHEARDLHIYEDMLEDMVYLEINTPLLALRLPLMSSADWRAMGLPTKARRLCPGKEEQP